jgi:4-amino-4-deoxy-L-arabinose transferase-like glycosyltransferase
MDRLVSSRRVLFVLVLPLIALGASFLLLYSTPQGLGLNDDSIAYIAGARSLLSGQGYREIWLVSSGYVTHFPPGFPGALAFLGWLLNIDPLRSARLLNALLFGLNTLFIGWLAIRMTASRVVGILTAVMFVLTPSLLRIHSNAMSEPLYIFFTLAAFLLLDIYLKKSGRARSRAWLAAAGSLIGLAYLTRYAALGLLVTALAGMFILLHVWRDRLLGALFILLGFLPWAIGWSLRNWMVGGSLTNRALGWHPITPENARLGIRTFSGFLVPVEPWQLGLLKLHGLFEALFWILGLGLLVWTLRAGFMRFFRGRPVEAIPFLNALYFFAYLLLLVATMVFFDPATKFQVRILAPLFVILILLLAWGLYQLAGWRNSRNTALLAAVLILAVSAFGQGRNLADLRRGGQVYANERWFDAPLIQALRRLPPEILIHSNQPGVVYLYVGRPGALLPDTPADLLELQAQVRSGKAVIAIFKTTGVDENTLAYYDSLGEGLASQKYNGDVIYSAP